MLILDLWGISFHAVVVFGLGKNLLFKSFLGHCALTNLPTKYISCTQYEWITYLGQVGLELSTVQLRFEVHQFFIRDLPFPFNLGSAFSNHFSERGVFIHPLLESLVIILGSNLSDIHGKHNEVKVSGKNEIPYF